MPRPQKQLKGPAVFRFIVSAAAAACLTTTAAAQTSPSKPLNMVAGWQALFQKNGPDGLVIFRVTVSELGRVAKYELLEEYPKGQMLSPGRINAYMASQRYKPALRDGVPVAEEVEEAVTRDDKHNNTTLRPSVKETIKAELEALKKHDTSGALLEDMADLYARSALTFTELGWYFYLQAPLNRMQRKFAAGSDSATKALDIQGYLPKGPIIKALNTERIVNDLMVRPEAALRYYDGWVKRAPTEVPAQLTDLIARYRADPEKNYADDIAYFGEAKPEVRESAAPSSGAPAPPPAF